MRRLRPVPLTTRPRVSVVIPCYNYGHFLPDAVTSALDQTGVEVDVLIVDDASTDDSASVAQQLAAEDPRVDVLLHETNRGHIQTYNDGLAKVTGDYVVLLSADDLLTKDALTRAAALLEARPDVGLVYGFAEIFSEAPPVTTRETPTSWTVWSGQAWLRRICRRGRNIILNPEAVMRRSVLEALGGGYDARHPHAGDMLLWMRAASIADVGRVNGTVQAAYRVHGANMHSTTYAGELADLREVRQAFDAFFAEGSSGLRDVAFASLAREALAVAVHQQVTEVEATEVATLAAELWPGLVQTARWGRYERRAQRSVTPLERRVLRGLHDLKWRLRWQRWRRLGT